MKITNETRQMVMKTAWATYKLSQWPWMIKMSFSECLKYARARFGRDFR